MIYKSLPIFLQNLVENSFGAVTVFFVLSGFVITNQAIKQSSNQAIKQSSNQAIKQSSNQAIKQYFLINRFVKLYPLYCLGVLLGFILSDSKNYKDLFLNLFFLQTAIPGTPFNSEVYNLPGWSLCAEFLFYLLFPVIFLLLRKFSGYAVIFFSLLFNFIYCTSFTYLSTPINDINPLIRPFATIAKIFVVNFDVSQQWVSYFNPYFKIFDFTTGIGIALIFVKLKKFSFILEGFSNIVIIFMIIYISQTPKLMNNYYGADFIFQVFGLFILISMLSKSKRVIQRNNRSSKAFNLLGASSYAFYILQYELIRLFVLHFSIYGLLVNSLLTLMFILFYTLFALGVYFFFQKPVTARFSFPKR